MATKPMPVKRANGTTGYKVQWWENGTRDGRTFDDVNSANTFKRLVEADGRRGHDRYPGDEIMARHGLLKPDDVAKIEEAANPPAVPVVTVGEAIERWMAYKVSKPQSRPTDRTMKEYRSLVTNYIDGTALAGMDVATVMSKPIQAWVTEQKNRPQRRAGRADREGVSPKSMNAALTLLSSMFKWATTPDSDPSPAGETPLRAISSPMAAVERFKPAPKGGGGGDDVDDDEFDFSSEQQRLLVTPGDYELFYELAYRVDPFWADMMAAAALLGLRFGEVSALKVGWVNQSTGAIMVRGRFSAGQYERGTKGSSAAEGGHVRRREVRIPESAIPLLVACCEGKAKSDLVFDGPDYSWNRKWISSVSNRRWEALTDLLAKQRPGLYLRSHRLRHSYINYLQAHGVADVTVKQVVGHAIPGVTGHYTHMTEAKWAQVLAAVEPLARPLIPIRDKAHADYGPRHEVSGPRPGRRRAG